MEKSQKKNKINEAARQMGLKGGASRLKKIGKKGMSAMVQKGAEVRWSKDKEEK